MSASRTLGGETRIECIVGPSLSGKTYGLYERFACERGDDFYFPLEDDHAALFSFVHGLVLALEPVARGAVVSFNAMHDRLALGASPEVRVARWLGSHLQGCRCRIAIDNVEVLRDSYSVGRFIHEFVVALPSVRWIFSGRTLKALPIDEWLASELAALPSELRPYPGARGVSELLGPLTAGERTILAELSVLSALRPSLTDALTGSSTSRLLRAIHARTPQLFEAFEPLRLRRDVRTALFEEMRSESGAFLARIDGFVDTLVGAGQCEEALRVAQRSGSEAALHRLLERYGLEVAERASAQGIDAALRMVSEEIDEPPALAALRAAAASRCARYDVSERRYIAAIEQAHPPLQQRIVYAYGCDLLRRNRGDAAAVFLGLLEDVDIEKKRHIEIRSALAQAYVMSERFSEALEQIRIALHLLDEIEDLELRALVNTRAAYVHLYAANDLAITERFAAQGLADALETQSFVIAVGALSVLYNVACERDLPNEEIATLQLLADYSVKIGNIDFQSYGLIALHEIHVEAGDRDAMAEDLNALRSFDVNYETTASADALLPSEALERTWIGAFDRAYDLLSPTADQVAGKDFRAYRQSQLALYAAAAGRVDEAQRHLDTALTLLETLASGAQKSVRAAIFSSLAADLLGRRVLAGELLSAVTSAAAQYKRLAAFRDAAWELHRLWDGVKNGDELSQTFRQLEICGAAGLAMMLAQLPMAVRSNADAGNR